MLELITNRTQGDVTRVANILRKRREDRTPEEQEELDSVASKGAYNYTDLNRVTKATEYLNEVFTRYGYITGYEPTRIERPGNSRLPNGYTELEYIESTGTQSINTGVLPTSDYEFTFDFSFTSNTKRKLMGHTTNAGWYFGTTASNTYDCGKSGAVIDLDATVRRTIKVKSVGMTQTLEIDGMTSSVNRTLNVSEPLSIFKITNSTTLSAMGKLYNAPCQIKQGGKLIRDFVPCKSPDGSIGLYDFVSRSFYGNASSGSFIAGPVMTGGNGGGNSNLDPYTWYESDIPTVSSMEAYLNNIISLKDALGIDLVNNPPGSMQGLTFQGANNIEKSLIEIYHSINDLNPSVVPCGEAVCGEDYL